MLINQSENASNSQQINDLQLNDGPCLPNNFWYRGKAYPIRGRKLFDFLNCLWHKRNRYADYAEFSEPVWHNPERDITRDMIGALRRGANRLFRSNAIPFKVKTRMVDRRDRIAFIESHNWENVSEIPVRDRRGLWATPLHRRPR